MQAVELWCARLDQYCLGFLSTRFARQASSLFDLHAVCGSDVQLNLAGGFEQNMELDNSRFVRYVCAGLGFARQDRKEILAKLAGFIQWPVVVFKAQFGKCLCVDGMCGGGVGMARGV
eukprot:gnl/MRDRNA2_/MRDRNA2_84997_c0_seq1.p3 gnl/MRDRNA2_/MRDRNA2_84997_c0~~gnl/MRDRNA2_/MRDRNA2_84997_c0_seq1.p3  ORF type:complete len:118 (+),score=15.70 gnl/MRDRNA2_/MRDRNA2_84997_c0_seq1:134-487(+)